VLEAPTAESRLAVIHGLKQQQWLARLPRKGREGLKQMPAEKRAERLKELRLDDWPQRVLWQRPLKRKADPIPRPKRMSEFPVAVQQFLQENLLPRLSESEKKELERAQGRYPDYPRLVASLADRYPVLPPLPNNKITRWEQLPGSVRS